MSQTSEHQAGRAEGYDASREISASIDRTLRQRSAPRGTWRAEAEHVIKRGCSLGVSELRRRPSIAVVLFGGLAILAADAIGIGELAMGIGVGYAAWKVFRKGEPLDEALREAHIVGGE